MDRATADYMGMLGTIMNGMAMQDALEKHDIPTRLMSALNFVPYQRPIFDAVQNAILQRSGDYFWWWYG